MERLSKKSSGIEDVFKTQKLLCMMGIKAFQNLTSALEALNYLLAMPIPKDHIPVAALFQNALIQYCKPFINSRIEGRDKTYPTKKLTSNAEFDRGLHEHIRHLRKKLLAHDDFDEIEPEMHTVAIKIADPNGLDIHAYPDASVLTNKQLLFPNDLAFVERLRNHVYLTAQIVYSELELDVKRYGDLIREHNAEFVKQKAKYETVPSKVTNNLEIDIPTPESIGLTNGQVPVYEIVEKGYCYAIARYVLQYDLPKTHTNSNGVILNIERISRST